MNIKKFLPFLLTAFLFGSAQQETKCSELGFFDVLPFAMAHGLVSGQTLAKAAVILCAGTALLTSVSIFTGWKIYKFFHNKSNNQYKFELSDKEDDTHLQKTITNMLNVVSTKNINNFNMEKWIRNKKREKKLNNLNIKTGEKITLHITRKKGNVDFEYTFYKNSGPLAEQLIQEWKVIKEKIIEDDSYFNE